MREKIITYRKYMEGGFVLDAYCAKKFGVRDRFVVPKYIVDKIIEELKEQESELN